MGRAEYSSKINLSDWVEGKDVHQNRKCKREDEEGKFVHA